MRVVCSRVLLEKALSKLSGGVSGLITKGEALLNNSIESIAIMLVTSCLIPLAVLMFALWVVKLVFGVEVHVPQNVQKKIAQKATSGSDE